MPSMRSFRIICFISKICELFSLEWFVGIDLAMRIFLPRFVDKKTAKASPWHQSEKPNTEWGTQLGYEAGYA